VPICVRSCLLNLRAISLRLIMSF